jgi:pyruvate/2-oxoglutarate dehydrogenase complex dihydrolipoamide acyltransferase (E2) component
MAVQEAKVPDIGNYTNVPVIEVLVKVGDTVTRDQGLVTLESDKATMEVPAPFDGIVREIKVKVGDEISEGTVVALVEDDGKGFDVASVLGNYGTRGSLGLLQMRESARLIGAQLSIDSSVGNGTRIRLKIPKPS